MKRIDRKFGCKHHQPHDLVLIHETTQVKIERCKICGKRFRWNKTYKRRIDNKKYLKAHVRNYAQKWGRTSRIYYKIYKPNELILSL